MSLSDSSSISDPVSYWFARALEIESEERVDFLDQHCDDEWVREEVLALLDFDDAEAVETLGVAEGVEFDSPAGLSLVDRIADYEVTGWIGRGGMGVVYEARQASPERTVALKVMRSAFANAESLQRFELETRALARLQHPGIAAIYEAGTWEADGELRPYYAMEKIEGASLDEALRVHDFSIPERLELFVQLCEAVQHAHGRGVIHRDLKPANVLVSHEGLIKVLDFGIARVEGDGSATVTGQIVGTLEYMSPEQLGGGDGSASGQVDIYALGVLLFQMLANRLPVDVSGLPLAAAAQKVTTAVLPRLSEFDSRFRGDVEAIVAKALQRDPAERYQTVAELAADVQRHQRHEPVTARPLTAFYQLRQFTRRHRGVVFASVLVVAMLSVSLVVSLLALDRESRAREQADVEAQRSGLKSSILERVIESAAPAAGSGREITVRELLAGFSTQLDDVEDPKVEVELRTLLGRTYLALDRGTDAAAELEKGLAAAESVRQDEPERYFVLLSSYGTALRGLGRTKKALPLLEESVEGLVATLGETSTHTLGAQNNLALAHYQLGDVESAAKTFRRLRDAYIEGFGADDTKALRAAHNYASTLLRLGETAEAERQLEDLVERRRRILGLTNPDTLRTLGQLAGVYRQQQRHREALATFQEIHASQLEVLGDRHSEVLLTQHNMAQELRTLGEFEQAVEQAESAYRVAIEVLDPGHPRCLDMKAGWVTALASVGKFEEALKPAEELVAARLERDGVDHPRSMRARSYRARILLGTGEAQLAADEFEELIEATQSRYGSAYETAVVAMDGHRAFLAIGDLERQAESLNFAQAVVDQLDPEKWYRAYLDGRIAAATGDSGRLEAALATMIRLVPENRIYIRELENALTPGSIEPVRPEASEIEGGR